VLFVTHDNNLIFSYLFMKYFSAAPVPILLILLKMKITPQSWLTQSYGI